MVANLNTAVIYCGILTLEKNRVKITAVNYSGIFIKLAPVLNVMKTFFIRNLQMFTKS
jgi:hypothetical protein